MLIGLVRHTYRTGSSLTHAPSLTVPVGRYGTLANPTWHLGKLSFGGGKFGRVFKILE